MKVQGLSKLRDRQSGGSSAETRPTPVMVPTRTRKTPDVWGRTFDGEQQLHDLWNSGEIANYGRPSSPENRFGKPSEIRPEDHDGRTQLERLEAALGYTPASVFAEQRSMMRRGLAQPTSKGIQYIEPNILELRLQYAKEAAEA